MTVLADILRVLDVVLVVSYFPVIAARYRSGKQQHRLYLMGVLFVLFGIISGSAIRFGEPFRGPALFYFIGMSCMWSESIINIRRERRAE